MGADATARRIDAIEFQAVDPESVDLAAELAGAVSRRVAVVCVVRALATIAPLPRLELRDQRLTFTTNIDENTVAFSMLERLSYANIQSNPKAAYMFIERGEGYNGKRLYLTMTGEEKDPERITDIKKQHVRARDDDGKVRHLIYFTVDRTRPLVGG